MTRQVSCLIIYISVGGLLPALTPGYTRALENEGAGRTVTVEGVASLEGLVPSEGVMAALRSARLEAVTQACSLKWDELSWARDPEGIIDFIGRIDRCQVLGEKVHRWDALVDQRRPQSPPQLSLQVTAEIRTDCQVPGTHDPYFAVHAELERARVGPGEELGLVVTPTRDSRLTVIWFTPDDSVYVAYPNCVQPGRIVRGGEGLQIPADMGRRTGLARLEVGNPIGTAHRRGLFWVVATLTRISVAEVPQLGEGLAYLGGPPNALDKTARWLVSIPATGRTSTTVEYEVASP